MKVLDAFSPIATGRFPVLAGAGRSPDRVAGRFSLWAVACLGALGAAGQASAAPSVAASVTDALLNASEPSTDVLWSAGSGTSYEIRVGGTDCVTGLVIDSGGYTPPDLVTSTVLAGLLSEGPNTLRVCVTDAVLVETGFAEVAVTIDTTTPQTSLDSGPPAVSPSTTATFTFSSPEPGVSFECSLDGAPFSPCTTPALFGGLSDDTHVFLVRARTGAGTADPSPAAVIFAVDTIAPDTNLTSVPPATSNTRSASVAFTSNEPGAVFQCSVDGAAFVACTSPRVVNGLADREHTVSVRALDQAGNLDASPAVAAWVVDAPPETTIESAPDLSTPSTSGTFWFSSSDAGSTFQCQLDAAPFSQCTSPRTLLDLGPGQHRLDVRAVDPAGQVDATPARHIWTVDPVLPKLDSTRPGKVRKARARPGDHTSTLTWKPPKARDFDHVEIVRNPGPKKAGQAIVYAGAKTTFKDRRLKNGVRYRYRIFAVDRSGNRSKPVVVRSLSSVRALLGKRVAMPARAPFALLWKGVQDADFYNVQLFRGFRGDRKVLSRWPAVARLSVGAKWKFEGRAFVLKPGSYRWFVWPAFGQRATAAFGDLHGSGTLVVTARR